MMNLGTVLLLLLMFMKPTDEDQARSTACDVSPHEVMIDSTAVLTFRSNFKGVGYIYIRLNGEKILEINDLNFTVTYVAPGFEYRGIVDDMLTLVIKKADRNMQGEYEIETSHSFLPNMRRTCRLTVTEPVADKQESPVSVSILIIVLIILINDLGNPQCTLRTLYTQMRKRLDRQRDQSPPTEIKVVGQSEDGGRKNDFTETNDQGVIDQVKWKKPMLVASSEHVSGQEEGDMLGDNPVDRVMVERQDLLSN